MKANSSAAPDHNASALPSRAANRSDPETCSSSPAVFHTRLKVRWNELDANGHVNNMYYQSYFDQARIEAFEQAGLNIEDMREQGIGPVIYKAELDYRRELKHPDSITVTTWVQEHRRSRGVLAQQIESDRTGDVVCTARFHGIFMDLAAGRPVPFPRELLNGAAALPDYRL